MRIASFYEGTVLALDQLRANKTRAALTILGIVVGVFVVMVISAVISGIRTTVMSDIEQMGPRNFTITRWDMTSVRIVSDGTRPPWWNNKAISPEELHQIVRLPSIKGAIPAVDANGEFSYAGQRVSSVPIAGRGAEWAQVQGGIITAGHNYLPSDDEAAHAVVLINDGLARDLFGAVNPLGRRVRINGQSFEVIGVVKLPDNIFTAGVKHFALVPWTAAVKYLGSQLEWLQALVRPVDNVPQAEAMDQVTVALRTMRGLRPGAANNFVLTRADEIAKTFDKITRVFFLVMIALSAVGLMVGGVGVIAIMMIAVTERTREIGVRKALGATQHEILWQFLIEAVTVTFIGAVVGLAVGGAGAFLVAALSPIPAHVPPLAIVFALGSAVVAGVVFGIFPAWRAARLDPVEALRYE